MKLVAMFLLVVAWASAAYAQLAVGNWERTDAAGKGMTLTVESCCSGGLRLTYHVPAMGGQPASTLTVDSPMNGTEVPVLMNGKPSGETMAIKRVDDRHFTGVVKMNGQPMSTSATTISADGKSATTESMTQASGTAPQKVTETWVKK
jgi:hypothetical protein